MTIFSEFTRRISSKEEGGPPRILVFGDSHTAALTAARAYPKRASEYRHIRILRLRKKKDGRAVGDTALEGFCRRIRKYRPADLVFSAVGGNQYSIVSTVKNPIDFDLLGSAVDDELAEGATLVPYRAMAAYIESGVRGNDAPILRRIRESTAAQVFHLVPPPPKQDNSFIESRFEGRFVAEGLREFGPTRPELRLKCWKIQLACLLEVCRELDIRPVLPPKKALTAEGFLAPNYYADDVTHGNRRYGELVLRQLLELASDAPLGAAA